MRGVLFTSLINRVPLRGPSSSLELGVCGGVGGSDGDSVTVTSRMSETDIVASEAISRVKDSDRGVVVNTTKYGREEERGKVRLVGRVIYCQRVIQGVATA